MGFVIKVLSALPSTGPNAKPNPAPISMNIASRIGWGLLVHGGSSLMPSLRETFVVEDRLRRPIFDV